MYTSCNKSSTEHAEVLHKGLDSTSTLECGKYNQLRAAIVLDVDKRATARYNTIDIFDQPSPKAPTDTSSQRSPQ